MVVDPSAPNVNNNDFEKRYWICSEFSSIIKTKREVHTRASVPRRMGLLSWEKQIQIILQM